MAIFRAKVTVVATLKTYIYVYSISRLNGYQTTIDGYNSPTINVYSKGKTESVT
jgi:hypothetical protein